MKILLDECVDRRLAKDFIGYEIKTVPQMGWAGIKDNELLVLASAVFDVFITADRNLSFQQNLSQFDLSLIVLQAQSNRLADLKPLVPKVLDVLDTAPKGQATLVCIEL
jgi:predicted nuclease of predicted toxin-antitoxin system